MATVGLLALAILAQGPSQTIAGVVFDTDGKPAAGAEVFLSSGMTIDGAYPALAEARTDVEGRFRLAFPLGDAPDLVRIRTVWAYQEGQPPRLGLNSVSRVSGKTWPDVTITLMKSVDRRITLKDADGRPIEGARLRPSTFYRPSYRAGSATPPDPLADRLAATTDALGRAVWRAFAADDQIFEGRVHSLPTGVQVVSLSRFGDAPAESLEKSLPRPASIVWKFRRPDGSPAADLDVEVWSRPDDEGPRRVRFDGESRTDAQGIFRTPAVLFDGQPYRALVRADGMAVLLTGWTKAGGAPEPIEHSLRPLRKVVGKVVNRQGMPVSGALVFQRATAPEPTETRTDADGRFELPGVPTGPVYLFARADGFRFQGRRLVGEDSPTLTLTRLTEDEPAEPMTTLPDILPEAERKAITRRILAPCLDRVLPSRDDAAKYACFSALIANDPGKALERVEKTTFEQPTTRSLILGELAREIGRDDPREGIALLESIADPLERAGTIVDFVKARPDLPIEDRQEWLASAAVLVRSAPTVEWRIFHLGYIAEMLWDLGDENRARALLEECRALVEKVADPQSGYRGAFASRLARIDLPAALKVLEGVQEDARRYEWLRDTAVSLARIDPNAAEMILDRLPPFERYTALERTAEALVTADRERAQRLVESHGRTIDQAAAWLLMARAMLGDDPAAARGYARRAVEALADLARDPRSADAWPWANAAFLPIVEEVDPGLVREAFWLALSAQSTRVDPRKDTGSACPEMLALLFARYDRTIAEDLLAPSMAALGDPRPGAVLSQYALETLAAIDPRRAESYIARLPDEPGRDAGKVDCGPRPIISELIANPLHRRWSWIWRRQSGVGDLLPARDAW